MSLIDRISAQTAALVGRGLKPTRLELTGVDRNALIRECNVEHFKDWKLVGYVTKFRTPAAVLIVEEAEEVSAVAWRAGEAMWQREPIP